MVIVCLGYNRKGLEWRKAWCLLYVVVYFIHQNKRRDAPLGSTESDLKRLCSSMIQFYRCLAAQYLSHQYHLTKLGFINSATLVTNELWQDTNPSKNNSPETWISSTQPKWHQNKNWWNQWRYNPGTGLGIEVVMHKEWSADMFNTFASSIFPLLFMFISQTILLSIMYIELYFDQVVLFSALRIGWHVLESFYITAIPHTLPYSNTKWVIHSPRISASSAFLSPFRDGVAQARWACSCGGSSIRELVLVSLYWILVNHWSNRPFLADFSQVSNIFPIGHNSGIHCATPTTKQRLSSLSMKGLGWIWKQEMWLSSLFIYSRPIQFSLPRWEKQRFSHLKRWIHVWSK